MYARNLKFQVSVHFRGGATLILLKHFQKKKKKKVKAEVKLYATLEGKKKAREFVKNIFFCLI